MYMLSFKSAPGCFQDVFVYISYLFFWCYLGFFEGWSGLVRLWLPGNPAYHSLRYRVLTSGSSNRTYWVCILNETDWQKCPFLTLPARCGRLVGKDSLNSAPTTVASNRFHKLSCTVHIKH